MTSSITASSTPASVDVIRRKMTRGTNFFGPEEVAKAFGMNIVPPCNLLLPTEREMDRAKELGQRLILCGPISMVHLYETFANKLGDGKLLYNLDWYGDGKEEFFAKVFWPDWHYRFTMEGSIEGTLGENYLTQTCALVTYLTERVYEGQPLPKLYADAVEEFNRREEALADLMDEDWQKAAEELTGLQVNQIFRETPDLVLWDIVLHNRVNGGYILSDTWVWTNQRSSDGRLVFVGSAGEGGVDVDSDDPRYSHDRLGARFSCRVQDLVA